MDYINSKFKVVSGPIYVSDPIFDVDGKDAESISLKKLSNSATLKIEGYYEDAVYKLYFEKLRFSELLALFEILINNNDYYLNIYKSAIKNYQPNRKNVILTRENSEIIVVDFTLTDGGEIKTISWVGT